VTGPDERQKAFAVIDSTSGQFRALTCRDVYQNTATIRLHEGVPDVIRSHFATAQNLLVFSWFFYPFNVTAEFLAHVTVELALKERFKPERRQSFRDLVKLAVAQGLVKDEGFSRVRERSEPDDSLDQVIGVVPQQVTGYAEILIDTMPYLRNTLAHGSPMLHPNGASSVRLCAEFINQLFPRRSS
jgi:hypothetical protein